MLLPIVAASAAGLSLALTITLARHGLHRQYVEALAGSLGGFLGFWLAGLIAPSWKVRGSLVGLAVGCWLAWDSMPWFDPISQRPSNIPFCAAVGGMVAGTLLTWLRVRDWRK